jgi:4-diphosphocytidyl-2-C-methyl-D-erythritol kinase
VRSAPAFAKINLSLVVGPLRHDGKHEVVTVLQRVDLHDTVELVPVDYGTIVVEGFEDTIVRRALESFNDAVGVAAGWHVRLDKRIPVAAGLGGGSSDAAAALRLANALAAEPHPPEKLHGVAAELGSDVPFFLREGSQLATADGTRLAPVSLPLDVHVVLVLPERERKESTASVYKRFDERGGPDGFDARRKALLEGLERAREPLDLAALPRNDLSSSPLAAELERLGAFRADVSGAGPAVYGLFERREHAERAGRALGASRWVRVAHPVPGP